MDNSDTPKARRPLPTPGLSVSQRPNTPVSSPSPVRRATFYGSQNDMAPDLLPPTEDRWVDDTNQASKMWPAHENRQESTSGWDANSAGGSGNIGTALGFEPMDYVISHHMDHDFTIDGRSTYEETHWWNPKVREENKRPGPGVLPPVLAEELHGSNHSLFSVNVTLPSTPSSSNLQDHSPPTEEEVRTLIPHPNAYFCPKDNGWVILSWKSSSVAPPLARSYIASGNPPLPDQVRRRRVVSCIEKGDQPFGKTNKTHHFHKYKKAVDSHKLTPPYRKDKWESLETVKQRRRVGAIATTDLNITIKAVDHNIAEEEGELLDLYVCCQCSFYCVASGIIPGVIPRSHLEELVQARKRHPAVDMSAERSIELAVTAFLM